MRHVMVSDLSDLYRLAKLLKSLAVKDEAVYTNLAAAAYQCFT
jgi:hypothetical protein